MIIAKTLDNLVTDFPIADAYFYLDEFVVCKGRFVFSQNGLGQAGVADRDHGL